MACNNTTGVATLGCCGAQPLQLAIQLVAKHSFIIFTNGLEKTGYSTATVTDHWWDDALPEHDPPWGAVALPEAIRVQSITSRPRFSESLAWSIISDTRNADWLSAYEGTAWSRVTPYVAGQFTTMVEYEWERSYWGLPGRTYYTAKRHWTRTLALENEYDAASSDFESLLNALDLSTTSLDYGYHGGGAPECYGHVWFATFNNGNIVLSEDGTAASFIWWDPISMPPYYDVARLWPPRTWPADRAFVNAAGLWIGRDWSAMLMRPNTSSPIPEDDFLRSVRTIMIGVKSRVTSRTQLCVNKYSFGQSTWTPENGANGNDKGWEVIEPVIECTNLSVAHHATPHPVCPNMSADYLDVIVQPDLNQQNVGHAIPALYTVCPP